MDPPEGYIARSIVYAIKRSAEPQAWCTPRGKYNVIVITTGLLTLFERAAPLLAAMRTPQISDVARCSRLGALLSDLPSGETRSGAVGDGIRSALAEVPDAEENARCEDFGGFRVRCRRVRHKGV